MTGLESALSMREFIERLGQLPTVRVEAGPSQWTVHVPKTEDTAWEIVVPYDVLEWFVTVRRGGVEVWSDWLDYVGYTPAEPLERLASAMRVDIEWFTNALLAVEGLRVESRRWLWILRYTEAEWCFAGRWRPVCMSAEAGDGPGSPAGQR